MRLYTLLLGSNRNASLSQVVQVVESVRHAPYPARLQISPVQLHTLCKRWNQIICAFGALQMQVNAHSCQLSTLDGSSFACPRMSVASRNNQHEATAGLGHSRVS